MSTPSELQALYEMSQILQGDPWARHLYFEVHAHKVTFGFWDPRGWENWKLNPSKDMMAIHTLGHQFLLNNLKIAMIMEAVGLGSQRYCIIYHSNPEFYSKLKLILSFLPQEKTFLYPTTEGPFLQEPWLSRA